MEHRRHRLDRLQVLARRSRLHPHRGGVGLQLRQRYRRQRPALRRVDGDKDLLPYTCNVRGKLGPTPRPTRTA